MLLSFFKYFFSANSLHGTHSPYIYKFYESVFFKDTVEVAFHEIEGKRKELLKDKKEVFIQDFGTGKDRNRKLSDIAKKSLKKPKWGRALYRLVSFANPKNIIELGTSLGITTSYLASASKNSEVVTFEGSPEIISIAGQVFEELQLNNIQAILGNIDDTLPAFLDKITSVDVVFIDANHSYEATIAYFKLLLTKTHSNSILIFDDIYWSKEMTKAWKEIKLSSQVYQTIDLFEIGLVFFQNKQAKEHFVLRY